MIYIPYVPVTSFQGEYNPWKTFSNGDDSIPMESKPP